MISMKSQNRLHIIRIFSIRNLQFLLTWCLLINVLCSHEKAKLQIDNLYKPKLMDESLFDYFSSFIGLSVYLHLIFDFVGVCVL